MVRRIEHDQVERDTSVWCMVRRIGHDQVEVIDEFGVWSGE